MHASANVGLHGESPTVFFGLSGTGKTTLSAEANRNLIGDDEIVWGPDGLSNIEGGCYAKAIGLSAEKEPEIWNAIRFGCVLENVGFADEVTNEVDFNNNSITENTRACYPIEHIDNTVIPCVGGHPSNIIFLACDAFGVLPPVSKLTKEQAMFHFLSGYTAKVAGTEIGVTEPKETFSSCFGEAFLMQHPSVYAELLKKKVEEHNADVWLINTGWVKGGYGVGERISLKHTRAIINAIHNGNMKKAKYTTLPVFNLAVPRQVAGVPPEILLPSLSWNDQTAYMNQLTSLARKFLDNFENYSADCSPDIIAGGPKIGSHFGSESMLASESSSNMGATSQMRNYYKPRQMKRFRGGNLLETRRWSSTYRMPSVRPERMLGAMARRMRTFIR